MIDNAEAASALGVTTLAWLTAHHIGDRWLQTDHQAKSKMLRDRVGWLAVIGHVTAYTTATATLVGIVWFIFDLPITLAGFLIGQAFSAVSHLVIDRRYTLHWFVRHIAKWTKPYYEKVPGGAEHLDQSAHQFCVFIAAILTVLI